MIKIGFLPLYIELYDRCCPDDAVKAREYAAALKQKLESCGFEVAAAPVCRLKFEFAKAVQFFEEEQCEAIVTVHLAYSPSLEAVEALAHTDLPIVIMDTTPTAHFTSPLTEVMPNHGIHGVQDLGNQLLRNGKKFLITAGALDDTLLKNVSRLVKSAAMAYKMSHLRIGRAGGEFVGMGDFVFEPGTIGIKEVCWNGMPEPSEEEVEAEMAANRAMFVEKNLPEDVLRRTARVDLQVRRWVDENKLDGITVCFCGICRQDGWETVPFLEGSLGMARKIGYAGEGDVLTAGLHAALFKAFDKCGFSEMFCPDWIGGRIYVSHMGEINPDIVQGKAMLTEMNYKFSDTGRPAVAFGSFMPGKAVWVDLVPMAEGKFRLIAAPIEFEETPAEIRNMPRNSGFFRPASKSVGDFLAEYTRLGGTHHSVVVYNGDMDILKNFAELMNWDFQTIL